MERSSFFTSLNGDRKYKSEDFADFFKSFLSNGVFAEPATTLQVTATTGDMNITIKPGKAWINGYLYKNDTDLKITLGYPDGTLSRIDTIVLRWDLPNREIKAYAIKGEFSEAPVAPSITRNEDIYELAIAHVLINRNAMSINAADITDLRLDPESCGIVTGLIDQVDTSELFAQIQAVINNSSSDIETWLEEVKVHYAEEFYAWFDTLRGSLDEDVAGSLLNKILELEKRVDNIKEELQGLSSTADKITLVESQQYFTATEVDGALVEVMKELRGAGSAQSGHINNILNKI